MQIFQIRCFLCDARRSAGVPKRKKGLTDFIGKCIMNILIGGGLGNGESEMPQVRDYIPA